MIRFYSRMFLFVLAGLLLTTNFILFLNAHFFRPEHQESVSCSEIQKPTKSSSFVQPNPTITSSSTEDSKYSPIVGDGEHKEMKQIWTRAKIKDTSLKEFFNVWNFRPWQKPTPDRKRDYDVMQALKHGARSKLTLRIVDPFGIPIPDVDVWVCPYLYLAHKKAYKLRTDESGIVVLQDRQADEYKVSMEKQGFYNGNIDFEFFNEYTICVNDGKWIPWNEHIELVMKPIGDYVSLKWMQSSKGPGLIPLETDIPFDFFLFDYLPPFGNGKQTNAMIRIDGTCNPDSEQSMVTLSFPFGGGIRREVVDGFSIFHFPREIAEDAFSPKLVIRRVRDWKNGKLLEEGLIYAKEYFALKIPVIDKNGTTKFCYGVALKGPYGTIDRKQSRMGSLYFEYFLNLEPGNRVVESDELVSRAAW